MAYNIVTPELRQRRAQLESQIAKAPAGSIPAGQATTLLLGLLFYVIVAAVTPVVLVLAMFSKPQLQLAISFLFRTPVSKLNNLRRNLDAILKILLVGGAVVAVFF